MLQISQSQMRSFDKHMEDNFAARLAIHLATFFPFCFGGDLARSTGEIAQLSLAQAMALGMRREVDITRYANLCALLGVGFEGRPYALNAGLALARHERCDSRWLDRIVPMVEELLRARG